MFRACERSVLLKNGPPTNIKQEYPNCPVVLSAKACGLKLRPYLLYTTIGHVEFAQASGTMLCLIAPWECFIGSYRFFIAHCKVAQETPVVKIWLPILSHSAILRYTGQRSLSRNLHMANYIYY